MDDRAEFEAWESVNGMWPAAIERAGEGYKLAQTNSDWRVWQVVAQRQQERIAELEAQVQALSLDAGRYQFLRNGGAYLEPNTEEIYMATDDGGKYYHDRRDFDMDIDAAIASGKGET